MKTNKRNFGLDLLRAISIWLVLLQHAGINITGLTPLKIGVIGVEIFFVISGFLIGGILFREIDKQNNLFKTLTNFWVRRWYRILPLYYLTLLFKFIVIDSSIGTNILYYVFFLQNNFYGISYLQVSWSLVIEEWFYLFSPLFLFFAVRYLKKEKYVALSMLFFILLVIILRTIYVINGNIPYTGVNGNFPFRFDSLFIGVFLSYINYKKWSLYEKLKTIKTFFLGLILFIGYIYYFWTLSYPNNLINTVLFPRTLGFFILPFSIGLMIPFTAGINADKWNKIFVRFIITTSILTYAIYLTHSFIYSVVFHSPYIQNYFLNVSISILLTYIVSYIVYIGFEKPILNFRDKITRK